MTVTHAARLMVAVGFVCSGWFAPVGLAQTGSLEAEVSSPGAGVVGENVFRLVVRNVGPNPVIAVLSLQTRSPSRGWGSSYYVELKKDEERTLEKRYLVPHRGFRVLSASLGIAETRPSADDPYPEWSTVESHTFAVGKAETSELGPSSWQFDLPVEDIRQRITKLLKAASQDTETAKDGLRELVGWDRALAPYFSAERLESRRVGDYEVVAMRIQGERGQPIEFLTVTRSDLHGTLPAVLYLGGNPPGTKERGLPALMRLADAGWLAVSMDRRPSARVNSSGELLSSIADPVVDARRLVDYLTTREDVSGDGVAVVGFSKGAEEGAFLTALHDSVRVAVLIARPIDQSFLFKTSAWLPTLYDPDVVADIGLGELLEEGFRAQLNALTPAHHTQALAAYRARYPLFDRLDLAEVLSLVSPKPVLVITGARDEQFPLNGVLALDRLVHKRYVEQGVGEAWAIYIMPRAAHDITPRAFDLAVDFLRVWWP